MRLVVYNMFCKCAKNLKLLLLLNWSAVHLYKINLEKTNAHAHTCVHAHICVHEVNEVSKCMYAGKICQNKSGHSEEYDFFRFAIPLNFLKKYVELNVEFIEGVETLKWSTIHTSSNAVLQVPFFPPFVKLLYLSASEFYIDIYIILSALWNHTCSSFDMAKRNRIMHSFHTK